MYLFVDEFLKGKIKSNCCEGYLVLYIIYNKIIRNFFNKLMNFLYKKDKRF